MLTKFLITSNTHFHIDARFAKDFFIVKIIIEIRIFELMFFFVLVFALFTLFVFFIFIAFIVFVASFISFIFIIIVFFLFVFVIIIITIIFVFVSSFSL